MAREVPQFDARGGVPYTGRPVVAPGHNVLPVRTERRRPNTAGVPEQFGGQRALVDSPKSHDPVAGAGSENIAVRSECEANDPVFGRQGTDHLPRLQIPHAPAAI